MLKNLLSKQFVILVRSFQICIYLLQTILLQTKLNFNRACNIKKIVYFLLSFFVLMSWKWLHYAPRFFLNFYLIKFSLNVFFIVSYLYFSCYMKKYLDMISFSSRLNDSIFVIKYCKSYATICNNCLYRIHAKTKQFVFSPVSQLIPM